MNIGNLKIDICLALGFGMVLVLLSVISAVGIWRLQDVGEAANAMTKRPRLKERIAAEWLVVTRTNSIRSIALVKSRGAADPQYFQKGMAKTSLGITENSKKLFDLLETAEGGQRLPPVTGGASRAAAYQPGTRLANTIAGAVRQSRLSCFARPLNSLESKAVCSIKTANSSSRFFKSGR